MDTKVNVSGMTCGHCVASVTEEVSKIEGVTDVTVDLESGQVQITSAKELRTEDITSAIEEAGYLVV
jgi:copper ion binding protein